MIADEAYSLMTNLLKPYSKQDLNAEREMFNINVCLVLDAVECGFGILRAK